MAHLYLESEDSQHHQAGGTFCHPYVLYSTNHQFPSANGSFHLLKEDPPREIQGNSARPYSGK